MERKLFYGFIRNNYRVQEFSDRDIARFESILQTRALGRGRANRRLVEVCDNFRPELLVLGHADIIRNETLEEIRKLIPNLKIAYRNCDPPFIATNRATVSYRSEVVDAIFLTGGGEWLTAFARPGLLIAFVPTPTDPAVEFMENFDDTEFDFDLVFCGVANATDPRVALVRELKEDLADLRFEVFGMQGRPPVWGRHYEEVLRASKMGLNLNRREGDYLYSSGRISQLMGNGLLTFVHEGNGLDRFFSDEHVVFFSDRESLVKQVRHFQQDDGHRRAVARAGWEFYHRHFSGSEVARFIVEATFGKAFTKDYIWRDLVVG